MNTLLAGGTKTRQVAACLAAVYVIWGSTYLAMRIAVEGLPPFFMASVRFLFTGTVLLMFLRWRGAPWPTRRQWMLSTPVGMLMFVLGNGTVAWAERHLSSGVAAVVCGTMPLWVATMGRFFGERTSPREWVAMVLGVLGVGVLSVGGELRADPISAVVLCVAPISWALGSLLSRRLPLPRGLMSAATQMLTGGALMAVLSWAVNEPIPWHPPLASLLAWGYLAIFGSLVAYSAYTWLLANTRPAIATSYSYVNPAFAVAIGAAFGHETPGPATFGAVALIVAATVMTVSARAR